jgi:WD40 repeat protein
VERSLGGSTKHWTSAVSGDGSRLATVDLTGDEGDERIDAEVRVWDVATGEVTTRFPLDGVDRLSTTDGRAAFTPDGTHLLVIGRTKDGVLLDVRWWSLTNGTAGRWTVTAQGRPHPVAVSREGRLLAVGTGQGATVGAIRLFDWVTGRERQPADGHATAVRAVAFTDDGRQVVTTDDRGDKFAWDAATGRLLRSRSGNPVPENESPDAAALYRLLKLRPAIGSVEARRAQPTGPDALITAWWRSADGRIEAVGVSVAPVTETEAGRVYLVDVHTGTVRWQAPLADAAPTAVRVSDDGSRVAVGTTVVTVFDAAKGKVLATFDGHRGAVTALAFSADGKRLASGSTDTTAVVWTLPQ